MQCVVRYGAAQFLQYGQPRVGEPKKKLFPPAMSDKIWTSFETGNLTAFVKALEDCPSKGQVLQIGPNPMPCQAAARGQLDFLEG
jgi:hypothetical protein